MFVIYIKLIKNISNFQKNVRYNKHKARAEIWKIYNNILFLISNFCRISLIKTKTKSKSVIVLKMYTSTAAKRRPGRSDTLKATKFWKLMQLFIQNPLKPFQGDICLRGGGQISPPPSIVLIWSKSILVDTFLESLYALLQ